MIGFREEFGLNIFNPDFSVNKVYELALEHFEFNDYNELFDFLDAYDISNEKLTKLMQSLYTEELEDENN